MNDTDMLCQDHIPTENIWVVWSETSYSGDKMRCYNAGRTDGRTNEQLKTELLSQWKLEAEFRNKITTQCSACGDFRGYVSKHEVLIRHGCAHSLLQLSNKKKLIAQSAGNVKLLSEQLLDNVVTSAPNIHSIFLLGNFRKILSLCKDHQLKQVSGTLTRSTSI